jgi:hypothetical protein
MLSEVNIVTSAESNAVRIKALYIFPVMADETIFSPVTDYLSNLLSFYFVVQ